MAAKNPVAEYGVVDPDRVRTLSGVEFLGRILAGELPFPPVGQAADIWPVAVEVGAVTFAGRPSARFYNPMGVVHGGWLSILLDTALGCAVHSALPAGKAYTTLELKVNFVRPVFERTGEVTCRGVLIHAGGRIATAEARVHDAADRLVAHGTTTCLIFDAPPARAATGRSA